MIKAFIPSDFFAEINDQLRRSQYQPEILEKMLLTFLDNFDQDEFQNVFVKWDAEMRAESHEEVKRICE